MSPATRAALSAACERGYRDAMTRGRYGDARDRSSVADRWDAAAQAVIAEAERLHVYVPVVARAVRRRQERELRRDAATAPAVTVTPDGGLHVDGAQLFAQPKVQQQLRKVGELRRQERELRRGV